MENMNGRELIKQKMIERRTRLEQDITVEKEYTNEELAMIMQRLAKYDLLLVMEYLPKLCHVEFIGPEVINYGNNQEVMNQCFEYHQNQHKQLNKWPTTLLDYFPEDFLLFVDESHVTLPQVRAMYGGDYARKKTLVEYGFRLPSAFDNRPLKFEEVESKLNQMIFVSATPGEYERQNSTQVAQQVIRPTGLLDPVISVRPVEGQVVDLLGEINTRIARQERVLVTTLTKKMAEDLTDYLTEQGIKVKYMHHEVDTFERMEIIKDLRLGSIDVVVGINLLREGLDLPEVSLVAILDADKEGFLRSETSLIQTIGRAARNAEGMVIMYADVVTDSMDRAITETERRRAIQMAYNQEHGIVPRTIVKAIADSIEISDKAENAKRNTRRMGKMEREAAIERLTREMKEAAKLLEFEHAAFLRDQIDRLRRGENPTVDSAAETERKQNHAQTQRKGRKYLGKR